MDKRIIFGGGLVHGKDFVLGAAFQDPSWERAAWQSWRRITGLCGLATRGRVSWHFAGSN